MRSTCRFKAACIAACHSSAAAQYITKLPKGKHDVRRRFTRCHYSSVSVPARDIDDAYERQWFPIGNLPEYPFKKVPKQFQERRNFPIVFFERNDDRRSDMKKISCVLAALAIIAVAAPTVASAEGFGFRIGSDRDYYRDRDDYRGPRAEFYEHDRGLHRGWYNHDGDRTVIIKRHHHWDD
jgi:hypothetical protein